MNLAICDHRNQIWPSLLLRLVFLYIMFFSQVLYMWSVSISTILALAFLGMYTWACRLWVSAINHWSDWSVISTGGVNMFISLTFHRSIWTPVFQSSHQIACGLEKCARCQGGMNPPQVKEVWLLRRVGFADYLHIFNDSSPRRVRALPQLGFFDTVNYSSHLITAALCLIPPACPQWERITSSSSATIWLCLQRLLCLCYVYEVPLWSYLCVWLKQQQMQSFMGIRTRNSICWGFMWGVTWVTDWE